MLGRNLPSKRQRNRNSISGVANWAANLLVSLTFPSLLDQFGNMLFVLYGIMGLLSLIFVSKYVKETKGRSLEEIEMDLRQAI